MTESLVYATKDSDNERPIPSAWRPVFSAIVRSFVAGDYALSAGVAGVAPVPEETAKHIQGYIEDYGEVLVLLESETWNSSVCLWMGTHWDVLLDLWTAGEGRSDLVLGAKVVENKESYIVEVGIVYVP